MLALLYVGYVMLLAKLKPDLAPPLPEAERVVTLPPGSLRIAARFSNRAMPSLLRAAFTKNGAGVSRTHVMRELLTALLPAIVFIIIMGLAWQALTQPDDAPDISALQEMGMATEESKEAPALDEPQAEGVQEPPAETIQEPPVEALQEPPTGALQEPVAKALQ